MSFVEGKSIKNVAIVGAGVIGAGWAARCLYRGMDVYVSDPNPEVERIVTEVIKNSEPALERVINIPKEKRGKLIFTKTIEEAVKNADYIQESAPEVQTIKIPILNEIDKYAREDAIICTSTSGLLPSELQAELTRPERFMVAHPFNPVYLLPLVEVVGGDKTDSKAIEEAMEFHKIIGMKPLRVRKEIEGFIADRLLEALWREILWLVEDDIATTEEIDDAIIYGAGLRWAFMGTNLTYYLAGGERGMEHFMRQFGPALKLPWTKLVAPELSEELIDKMVEGTEKQGQGRSFREWEALRDNCIVSIMEALEGYDYASGKVLKEDRKLQKERFDL